MLIKNAKAAPDNKNLILLLDFSRKSGKRTIENDFSENEIA